MSRDAFDGCGDPVIVDIDPEMVVLKLLLNHFLENCHVAPLSAPPAQCGYTCS
jgi:hypothetical protein